MNWQKLKERFPKSEKEIREIYDNDPDKTDGRALIDTYIESKGMKPALLIIKQLQQIEDGI